MTGAIDLDLWARCRAVVLGGLSQGCMQTTCALTPGAPGWVRPWALNACLCAMCLVS
jgi:hypothetical protein